MKLKMKKNKKDFDFKLSNIKENFDVQDFVDSIWEYIDGSLIYPILDSSIFIQESNNTFNDESNMDLDQINELQENIYSKFLIDSKNKDIKNQIYEDIFDGIFLPKINDNFKLELFFQYKNESHYLIYSKFNNLRIYIACVKDFKKNKIEAYVVKCSEDKISKLDFLYDFIYENCIKNSEENFLFENPENYISEETELAYTDYYLFFVKSNLPKINLSKKTKKEILQIIERDNSILEDLPNKLRKNKDFIFEVIKLCKQAPLPLYYVDDIFKKDKEVVFEAIKQDEGAFQFAHKDLKKNKDFILEVLNFRGDVLRYIDNSLKKDKEVALLAFEDLVGYQLKYLDKALKNDFEVVYAAVSTHGSALEFASDKLKKNKDIALRAIRNDPKAIKYVDAKLIEDRKFILEAIEVNLLVKEYLDNIN